jgi:uncharacterized Zn ribbon protein
MKAAWNPEIRAQRTAGPSAHAVARFMVLSSVVSAVCGAVAAGMVFQGSGGESVFFTVVAATAAAAAFSAVGGDVFLEYWVLPREFEAGYTTVFRSPIRFPHVDPRSDRVVRLRGEPALGRDEHRRRLALARESAGREAELRKLGGELPPSASEPSSGWAAVIEDVDGRALADGDAVTILRRVKSKKSGVTVPAGTLVHSIRLLHRSRDDRVVAVPLPGVGLARLRPSLVRKA